MSEDLFAGSLQSFWHTLQKLPVAPAIHSRSKATVVGHRDIAWRQSTRQWFRSGRVGTNYVARRTYERPGRIAILWDVSGSMADYLELYLPWLWRLVQLSREVGVFPFGTDIEEVTPLLRQPYRLAQTELSKLSELWAGGTTIGEILDEFQQRFAPVWVKGRCAVIIISDGWDSGSPERIAGVLRQWKRQDARIYWLNPLAATPGFEPRTRALKAAMPYVNRMLSGHSPKALRELYLDS